MPMGEHGQRWTGIGYQDPVMSAVGLHHGTNQWLQNSNNAIATTSQLSGVSSVDNFDFSGAPSGARDLYSTNIVGLHPGQSQSSWTPTPNVSGPWGSIPPYFYSSISSAGGVQAATGLQAVGGQAVGGHIQAAGGHNDKSHFGYGQQTNQG
jgi:hypothetical protein